MASQTARNVIESAARRAQILAAEEAPTAAEGVDWLRLLNQMMHAFPTKGIKYAHTDLAYTDTVNVPDQMLQAVILMLVDELVDDVGLTLGEKMANQIDDARRALQAFYHVPKRAVTDPALQYWPPGTVDLGRFGW